MPLGTLGAGFLAGVLSTLSPCVLPLLPLVLGAATAAHRAGPALLALGVAVSFTAAGLAVATLGFAVGLDAGVLRVASAVLLGAIGLVLLSGALQDRLALAAGPAGDLGHRLLRRLAPGGGPAGQLGVGLVLGLVWSPCVGPTLGAASLLAAQGRSLGAVAAVMFVFGLGTTVPLLVVALLSRRALSRWRGRLLASGRAGKLLMGLGALGVAVLVLTGLDRSVEAALVGASPDWLTDVTTAF